MSNVEKNCLLYAFSFLGVPYIYGGKCRIKGLDCSGFVMELLEAFGILHGELDAQQIHDEIFKIRDGKILDRSNIDEGVFLFFGKSIKEITHVALAIDEEHMIECGGGDHTTINLEEANRRRACVRIRPIKHRSDLINQL